MALREPPPKQKFAVIDGMGSTAEVRLYADANTEVELDWPAGWPSWVSWDFLESHGCTVIRA